jgi:serine/threonine-protein kinase HipA
VPVDVKPRVLTTAIDLEDNTASLKLAYEVAGYFELKKDEAGAIAQEAGKAVGVWRKEAAKLGITRPEIDRMASAFEHEDLKAAVTGK